MAKEKVDITADADTARAIEKLVAVAREYGKIGDAAAESGDKGARGAKVWAGAMDHLVGKWFTITKWIDLALEGIKKYLDESAKIRAEQVGATRTIDTGLTAYRIAQGNLPGAAGLDAAAKITAIAQQQRAGIPAAFGAAALLARFQVGREQAEGPALAELLQFQNVTKAGGGDVEGLSAAVLNALQRSQRGITGQNIRQFGAATLGLSRQIKGFDAGEIGITADMATYGRNAGLGLEETAAIVGILSEQYGEGGAKRQFRSLFKDTEFTREEKARIGGLRARAAGLLRGTERDYATAAGIYSGSMAAEEEQAETQYQVTGFARGITDPNVLRKRLIADIRRERGGVSPFMESALGTEFSLLNYLSGFFTENPAEFAVNRITAMHAGSAQGAIEARQRILGRQEVVHRLVLPDGRDVPSTTADDVQVGLGAPSNDPTQWQNFRP